MHSTSVLSRYVTKYSLSLACSYHSIKNGRVVVHTVPFTKGAVKVAEYSCASGHVLVGLPLRFCYNRFRRWLGGMKPVCAGNYEDQVSILQ